jgi:hypothetical protein
MKQDLQLKVQAVAKQSQVFERLPVTKKQAQVGFLAFSLLNEEFHSRFSWFTLSRQKSLLSRTYLSGYASTLIFALV